MAGITVRVNHGFLFRLPPGHYGGACVVYGFAGSVFGSAGSGLWLCVKAFGVGTNFGSDVQNLNAPIGSQGNSSHALTDSNAFKLIQTFQLIRVHGVSLTHSTS